MKEDMDYKVNLLDMRKRELSETKSKLEKTSAEMKYFVSLKQGKEILILNLKERISLLEGTALDFHSRENELNIARQDIKYCKIDIERKNDIILKLREKLAVPKPVARKQQTSTESTTSIINIQLKAHKLKVQEMESQIARSASRESQYVCAIEQIFSHISQFEQDDITVVDFGLDPAKVDQMAQKIAMEHLKMDWSTVLQSAKPTKLIGDQVRNMYINTNLVLMRTILSRVS